MRISSTGLIVASAVLLVMGVVVLVFTATVVRFMAHDDIFVLTTRYDPSGDAGYEPYRTYANLYGWAERLTHHRDYYAPRFHYTLGLSFIGVGLLLIAWFADRRRLTGSKSIWSAGNAEVFQRVPARGGQPGARRAVRSRYGPRRRWCVIRTLHGAERRSWFIRFLGILGGDSGDRPGTLSPDPWHSTLWTSSMI